MPSSLTLEGTILELTGLGIPPYSARGLTQTLEAIDQAAQFDRDVNGGLVNLSPPSGFAKYKSSISGQDVQPPAFNALPIGLAVTVDCIRELAYLTSGGTAQRTVVPGSTRTVGAWTFYRARLSMVIVGCTSSVVEWDGVTSWQIDLEEI